jgi:plasmid maintenance system antidote protein VapI
MNNNEKNLIDLISDENSNWKEKAEYRRANKRWLDKSAVIALIILNHLKEKGINQKQLAAMINVTPQYINKIVKGKENLSLDTITKLEEALGITLIEVISMKNIASIEKRDEFGIVLNNSVNPEFSQILTSYN